jgi:hypothetical protein
MVTYLLTVSSKQPDKGSSPSASHTDTVAAKLAFEKFVLLHHVTVQHYNCDNGIFAAQKFRSAVTNSHQTISFCGVNAHHQNGISERRIGDLTNHTCAMLIDAHHHNPYIKDTLWPFALGLASGQDRILPCKANHMSPIEKFSGMSIRPRTSHFHPFGSPTFVLSSPLQAGNSQPKWDDRARVGCYLGKSPQHTTSVHLILHPTTGHVSPQFHCVFDDNFETLTNLL